MQPLKKRVQSLRSDVMQAKQALQFDALAEELAVLEEQLNQPEIWNNPDHAQSVAKKAAALRQTVQPWQVLGVQLDDLLELMEPTVELDDGHRDRWGPVSTRGCKVSGRFPTRGRATGAGLPAHAHESALVGQHNELGPVTQLQLVQDPVEVGLDRRLGQDEVLGDLGVAHGASDQRDDLLLPVG